MNRSLEQVDSMLGARSMAQILAIAVSAVLLIGLIDHVTGFEATLAMLYLGPILMAAWYAGRWPGMAVSVLACVAWFTADAMAGQVLAHPAIEAWNNLLRLGQFAVSVILASALRAKILTLTQQAQVDALTGLFSRRVFRERLAHDLALARRNKQPLTIAYLDLDNFKTLNDARGHAEGDRALVAMGRLLKASLLRRGDTVARLGGDEFALVLPDTDERSANGVITELKRALLKEFESGGWGLDCSIGVATFRDVPSHLEDVLGVADALMYQAKQQGKGVVVFQVVGPAAPELSLHV